MTTLQNTYTRNGYTYKMERRTAYAVEFKMYEGDRFVGYEVGRVKVAKDGSIGGKFIEGGERFWSDEDFGKIAWWTASAMQSDIYFNAAHEAGKELADNRVNATP